MKTLKPKVCATCEHPRSEHVARVGCVHQYGVEAIVIGKSVCWCTRYEAQPRRK